MDANKEDGIVRQRKSQKNLISYVLGSIALFAAASAIIPVVMTKATGLLYKAAMKTTKDDND